MAGKNAEYFNSNVRRNNEKLLIMVLVIGITAVSSWGKPGDEPGIIFHYPFELYLQDRLSIFGIVRNYKQGA